MRNETKLVAEVGDVVRFKSGGPLMTVCTTEQSIEGYVGPPCAGCMWHLDDGSVESGAFPLGALDFIEQDESGDGALGGWACTTPPDEVEKTAKAVVDTLGEKLGEMFSKAQEQVDPTATRPKPAPTPTEAEAAARRAAKRVPCAVDPTPTGNEQPDWMRLPPVLVDEGGKPVCGVCDYDADGACTRAGRFSRKGRVLECRKCGREYLETVDLTLERLTTDTR